jgi:opacity protein-like surface antigen
LLDDKNFGYLQNIINLYLSIKKRIMKKMLLTAAIALTSLMASAQFMVTADLDIEDFDTDSIMETTDIGFGYMINDTWTVGATIPAGDDEDFRVFARYYWNESIYLTANTTSEDFSDNLRIGAGYSFAAYGSLYVEPNYTMNLSEDDAGERNGKFKLGLAYRF